MSRFGKTDNQQVVVFGKFGIEESTERGNLKLALIAHQTKPVQTSLGTGREKANPGIWAFLRQPLAKGFLFFVRARRVWRKVLPSVRGQGGVLAAGLVEEQGAQISYRGDTTLKGKLQVMKTLDLFSVGLNYF